MSEILNEQPHDRVGSNVRDPAAAVGSADDPSHRPGNQPGETTSLAAPNRGPLPTQLFRDWRTIDPATIRGKGIPVEETLYYQEKIDELMEQGAGRYVLIVGRKVIDFFDDLRSAGDYALSHGELRPLLIKKVSYFEPIHTIERVSLEPLPNHPTRDQ